MNEAEPIANLAAEENILGAMLISDRACEGALETLEPEHFYRDSHADLFRAIREMKDGGWGIDCVTVSSWCPQNGYPHLTQDRILELAGLVPATSNILHYCNIVKDAAVRRAVFDGIVSLRGRLETMTGSDAVAALEGLSLRVGERSESRHDTVFPLAQSLTELRRRFDSPVDPEALGIPVPFERLEPLLGGRVYILGGYQGDGKTASMLQFVAKACEAGKSVGVGTAEMSKADLMERWAAGLTGVSYRAIHSGFLADDEREKVEKQFDVMESWKCDIIDDERLTPGKLHRYQRSGRYDLLTLDHFHQLQFKDRGDIEQGMKQLVGIAREFNIPLLLLVQLSRSGDWKNPFPPPTMKSIRESGMIEALAAHIWFVWRKRDKEMHLAVEDGFFYVAKNRFGPTYAFPIRFDQNSIGFDATPAYEEFAPVEDAVADFPVA